MNVESILSTLGIWAAISTAILALAWIATFTARKNAALRHLIWVTAFTGLLITPILGSFIPGRLAPKPKPIQISSVDVPTEATFSFDPEPAPTPFNWQPVFTGLAIAWGVGTAVVLGRALRGFEQAQRMRREGDLRNPQEFGVIDHIGLKRAWELRVSSTWRPPAAMTWGAVKPVVLLPKNSQEWTENRMQTVLLHELAHVRRFDSLTQILALAMCAVYWFNPLVWLAAKALRADAEIAADDSVIRSGIKPSDYAEELLRLAAEFGSQRQPLTNIGVSIVKQSQIETRILSIVDPSRRRRGVARLEAFSVATVGLVAALALVSMRPAMAQLPDNQSLIVTRPAEESVKVTNVKLEKPRIAELPISEGEKIDLSEILDDEAVGQDGDAEKRARQEKERVDQERAAKEEQQKAQADEARAKQEQKKQAEAEVKFTQEQRKLTADQKRQAEAEVAFVKEQQKMMADQKRHAEAEVVFAKQRAKLSADQKRRAEVELDLVRAKKRMTDDQKRKLEIEVRQAKSKQRNLTDKQKRELELELTRAKKQRDLAEQDVREQKVLLEKMMVERQAIESRQENLTLQEKRQIEERELELREVERARVDLQEVRAENLTIEQKRKIEAERRIAIQLRKVDEKRRIAVRLQKRKQGAEGRTLEIKRRDGVKRSDKIREEKRAVEREAKVREERARAEQDRAAKEREAKRKSGGS